MFTKELNSLHHDLNVSQVSHEMNGDRNELNDGIIVFDHFDVKNAFLPTWNMSIVIENGLEFNLIETVERDNRLYLNSTKSYDNTSSGHNSISVLVDQSPVRQPYRLGRRSKTFIGT